MDNAKKSHPATLCAHLGRGQHPKSGFVNPPSARGSTYLYPTIAAFRAGAGVNMKPNGVGYGRYGSQTTRELEQAVATLDGAYGAIVTPSGFSAISTAILGCVSAGDHVLMVDTVYEPSRVFCNKTLKRLNIESDFYPADMGEDLARLIKKNTRVIFVESPGSLTFEIQDLEALIALAKKHNIVCILDNTWATSVNYPAISRGINVSVQAATKYIGGHSDLMMGIITTDEANWANVRSAYIELGHSSGTEETMLALRGLRTLPCRLKQHGKSALKIARWLESREEIARVYFPALESHPDHVSFSKQFNEASGLFSFSLKTSDQTAVAAMIDHLALFSIGVSWGGYESLILPVDPRPIRTANPWQESGQLIRISIGLEHPNDLINDLASGFERLNNALAS